MVLRDDDLRKRKVITADGKVVGQGAGLFFDAESLKVTAIAVKLHADVTKLLGAKKPLIGKAELKIPVDEISGIADTIILRPTAAKLLDAAV